MIVVQRATDNDCQVGNACKRQFAKLVANIPSGSNRDCRFRFLNIAMHFELDKTPYAQQSGEVVSNL